MSFNRWVDKCRQWDIVQRHSWKPVQTHEAGARSDRRFHWEAGRKNITWSLLTLWTAALRSSFNLHKTWLKSLCWVQFAGEEMVLREGGAQSCKVQLGSGLWSSEKWEQEKGTDAQVWIPDWPQDRLQQGKESGLHRRTETTWQDRGPVPDTEPSGSSAPCQGL